MAAVFSLKGDSIPADAVLVGFHGTEKLSQPFSLNVFVSATDAAALEDSVGTPLTLEIAHDGNRAIHGVIAEVEILEEQTDRSVASLTLVPRFWLSGHSVHSRVFTDESVPSIIKKVLELAGLPSSAFDLRLDADYADESHICQYKESDLAFVSRLMEHEGIWYFFEHGDQGEVLVLRDGPVSQSLGNGQVRFMADGDSDDSANAALFSLRARHGTRPKGTVVRDYNHENPQLDVSGQADAFSGGTAEVVVHDDDRFVLPARGRDLATIRAQELMAEQVLYRGHGRHFHLQPGFCFELDEHFVSRLNQTYLCVSLTHTASVAVSTGHLAKLTGLPLGDAYRIDLTAIEASRTYRPPRVTPRPRVLGLEIAVIDGPADSDYAQLDDQGRYRVVFKLDEETHDPAKASAALRRMQPHEGNPEGMHFPLRKGTEVMVAFLGGDPDRPLIVGAVPNAVTPSPVTSANHTRNVIHTGGNNRIEMEDQDGSEWIHISTPTKKTHMHLGKPADPASHHFELKTDGTDLFNIGSNQDIDVGGKLTEHVVGAVKETYDSSQTSQIKGPKETRVEADGCVETYKSTQYTFVSSNVVENYNAGQDTTVSASPRTEFFLSGQSSTVNAAVAEHVYNDSHLRTVSGATRNTHTGTLTRHVTGAATFMYPSSVERTWGPSTRKFKSLDWSIPIGTQITCGTQELKAPESIWSELGTEKFYGAYIYAGMLVSFVGWFRLVGYGAWISFANARKAEAFLANIQLIGLKNHTHAHHLAGAKALLFKFPKAAHNHT